MAKFIIIWITISQPFTSGIETSEFTTNKIISYSKSINYKIEQKVLVFDTEEKLVEKYIELNEDQNVQHVTIYKIHGFNQIDEAYISYKDNKLQNIDWEVIVR